MLDNSRNYYSKGLSPRVRGTIPIVGREADDSGLSPRVRGTEVICVMVGGAGGLSRGCGGTSTDQTSP